MGSQETVVQAVQVAGTSARVPKVRNLDRLGRRSDRDRTVSGNRRCSARIADPTKFEFGERRNVNSDNVSFARRRIVVVHALRSVGAGILALNFFDQTAKRSDHDWPSAQDGVFPHDEDRGIAKSRWISAAPENIHPDVERMSVNADRGIIGELSGIAGRGNQIVLKIEVGPHRACRNCAGVAHGQQNAVGQAARRVAGNVDDDNEPPS